MKGFLLVVLLASLAGLYIYKLPPQSPCDIPVVYKLGIIDTKFKLKESEVLDSAQAAAAIWNSNYKKPVFIYSPTASLVINFVYDERAALNTKIDNQKNQLDQKNSTLKEQISAYEKDLAVFQKKLSDFNSRVDEKNLAGGVSMDQYNELIKQRDELKTVGESLNIRAQQLNLATHDFNSGVNNFNQNVSKFNETIAIKPEEGVYDFRENAITIYFANNRPELIHTLAHEFGHVLGMEHVDDSSAIMYAYSTTSENLASADQAQLANVCKAMPLPYIWSMQISAAWQRMFQVINNPG